MIHSLFGQQFGQTGLPQSRPATAVQKLLFGGTTLVQRPRTIADTFERESSVLLEGDGLNGGKLLGGFIAKMDEAMTPTGEKYSGNEAFTTQFHLRLTPEGQKAMKAGKSIFGQFDRQVDWTKNVGKAPRIAGMMVMSGSITDAVSGTRLADARSAFCAIDPKSVPTGKNEPTALPHELEIDPENAGDVATNEAAAEWNNTYMKALGPVEKRLLGYKDRETNTFVPGEEIRDVRELPASDLRATDDNFYVPMEMINKKQTGHGGVSVAKAVQSMMVLAAKNFGSKSLAKVNLVELTASYKAPFVLEHTLQADTTVDHVDADGNVYLSTRLYKCDTKGLREQDRKLLDESDRDQDGYVLTGPVTIIHAKVKAPKTAGCKPNQQRFNEMLAELEGEAREDALTRQQEAITWSQIKF